MPRSHSCVYVHLVFSTKDRIPFLKDRAVREELHRYLGAVSQRLDCKPVVVGGAFDHVHILAALGRSISQGEWVKELKRVSHEWMDERHPEIRNFAWQVGYGAFSANSTDMEPLRQYILRQEEHHRTRTFQEEFLALLAERGMDVDERYLWT